VARIDWVPGRTSEPADLILHCVVQDTAGDLTQAAVSGPTLDTLHATAGSLDSVRAQIKALPAGEFEFVCGARDEAGRVHADTITVTIDPSRPPPPPISVAEAGDQWALAQGGVADPHGDSVAYTVVVQGRTPLVIGPRAVPIDTVLALPPGSSRVLSIVDDGFVADTTAVQLDAERRPPPAPRPTVTQTVVREGDSFRYTSRVDATLATLRVIRPPADTIYMGPPPADTTFAGLAADDRAGLLEGEYRFVLYAERAGQGASAEAVDTIPELRPTVDLSAIDAQLVAGDTGDVALPAPVDPNRGDAPTYTRATSLDGKVRVSLSGGRLSVAPVADSTGSYAIEVVVGDSTTGVHVDTLRGEIAAPTAQAQEADTATYKSGYQNVGGMGGATSVSGQLAADDLDKNPLIRINFATKYLDGFYDAKRFLNDKFGLAVGVDYSFVNQFSNFSTTDRQASSGIFRVFGQWSIFGSQENIGGALIYRIENRHLIGSGITPRFLGFDGGSALSTATFKEFGWGATSLYWKQTFGNPSTGFVVGKMDPGDYSDVFVLLTAYTAFMNDAYFNNPTVALPQQGFGLVGGLRVAADWQASAGIHDANGSPTRFGLDSLFAVGEFYTWAQFGWQPYDRLFPGSGVHVNVWHQDARQDKGTDETWGITLSANPVIRKKWSPFLRAGYSWGDGGQQVKYLIGGGLGVLVRKTDLVGIATSWSGGGLSGNGSDNTQSRSLRNQLTTEAYYRLQLTQNLAVTPSVQFTINPSHTTETDFLWVFTLLRMRLSL